MARRMKRICMFCSRYHQKTRPALCQAKSDIMRAYLDAGLQFWQLMHGVESGLIKLEAKAALLVVERTKQARREKRVSA